MAAQCTTARYPEVWGDELWEYSPDVDSGETTVRVVGTTGSLCADATVGEKWDERSQTYADLHEVNADLLKQCERLASWAPHPFYCDIKCGLPCTCLIREARAAIAKARGA